MKLKKKIAHVRPLSGRHSVFGLWHVLFKQHWKSPAKSFLFFWHLISFQDRFFFLNYCLLVRFIFLSPFFFLRGSHRETGDKNPLYAIREVNRSAMWKKLTWLDDVYHYLVWIAAWIMYTQPTFVQYCAWCFGSPARWVCGALWWYIYEQTVASAKRPTSAADVQLDLYNLSIRYSRYN